MKAAAIVVLCGAMLLPPAAVAIPGPVTVRVTSVSGRSIYLDGGSGSGIAVGMQVLIFVPGGARIEGIVRDVSSSSARAEIPPGVPGPPIGSEAVFDIPDAEQPHQPEGPVPNVPRHPPWTRQEEPRGPDTPLLSPARPTPPSEREPRFSGRLYTQMELTHDAGGDRDSQYLLARLGTSFTLTNPFKQGGRIQFAGEWDRRGAELLDGDLTDEEFILDRFSYAIGGEQFSPYRLEMGRFLSYYLPEIGVVDGVEGAVQLQNGLRLGGGVGMYPLEFPSREWGDDYGFHLFADYQPLGKTYSGTLGYQKTWHGGSPDRDVIMAKVNLRPTKSLWLYGSARIDIYDNSDPIKPTGLQLTDAWLQARYTFDPSSGVALTYSHYSWADLRRDEFEYVPIELIRDGRVDRAEVSGWKDLTKDVRLNGRVNYFVDQRTDGFGGEIGTDWNNVFGQPLSIGADVFYAQGSYADGAGFRVELRPGVGAVQGLLGYELFSYEPTGSVNGFGSTIRHTLRAGLSLQLRNWYINLTGDRYFGEFEDMYSVGTYIEYRY